MRVQEIKRRLDGGTQVFDCEALLITSDAAVLEFAATPDYRTDPTTGLPHHATEGYFWAGRPYLMYKMFGDGGQTIGYRFDVCTDVQISPAAVRFTDLLLDFWVDPQQQTSRFLDEDEIAAAAARGLLTSEHLAIIDQARRELAVNFRVIIAGAEALRAIAGRA